MQIHVSPLVAQQLRAQFAASKTGISQLLQDGIRVACDPEVKPKTQDGTCHVVEYKQTDVVVIQHSAQFLLEKVFRPESREAENLELILEQIA